MCSAYPGSVSQANVSTMPSPSSETSGRVSPRSQRTAGRDHSSDLGATGHHDADGRDLPGTARRRLICLLVGGAAAEHGKEHEDRQSRGDRTHDQQLPPPPRGVDDDKRVG